MRTYHDDEVQFLYTRAGQLPHQSVEQELIRHLIRNSIALENKLEKVQMDLFLLSTRTAKRTAKKAVTPAKAKISKKRVRPMTRD